MAWRVTPGMSFSGSKKTARTISRFSGLARSLRGMSWTRAGRLVKFGVDDDAAHVAHHEEGRVF